MNKYIPAEVFTRPNDRIRLHLNGRSRPYDARSTAIRRDLADVDVAVAQQYLSPHYAASVPFRCAGASAMVRGKPGDGESAVTQLLHGEGFRMLDERAGWAWGYCGHDHYVGYVRVDALGADDGAAPTHRVGPHGALLFTQADIKAPVTMTLPGGSLVRGEADGGFLATNGGWLHERHVAPVDVVAADWIEVARAYLGMPYLWGGRGAGGIDCSGLVQVALAACGIAVARDTDQQAGTIGEALPEDAPLARGDLVWFPGHVGIMSDAETLLHANAHWMRVVEEPLADVVARLAPNHARPITTRRRIAP